MSTVEEQLAWEAEKRPRAATIALLGGLLTLIGSVMLAVILSGGPTERDGFISVTEALQARLDGRAPEGPSLLVSMLEYWADKVALLSFATVIIAASSICLALTTIFLYRVTAARAETLGRVPYYFAVIGLVLYPLGQALRLGGQWFGAVSFSEGTEKTTEAARDVLSSPWLGAGTLVEFFGTFALAAAVVLVSLNAMRAGVLTRFLGVLGIVVGMLTIFQVDQPGIVRAFWLIAVGLLAGGRLRNTPQAWLTGRAEPWPTQQQLREQREAAAGRRAPDRAAAAEERPERVPGQARKKRKRRG